jgi:hypothetical protein
LAIWASAVHDGLRTHQKRAKNVKKPSAAAGRNADNHETYNMHENRMEPLMKHGWNPGAPGFDPCSIGG